MLNSQGKTQDKSQYYATIIITDTATISTYPNRTNHLRREENLYILHSTLLHLIYTYIDQNSNNLLTNLKQKCIQFKQNSSYNLVTNSYNSNNLECNRFSSILDI